MWERLDAMWSEGKGESEEADQLRDEMDGPWRKLTQGEIEKIRLYCVEVDALSGDAR